MNLTLQMERYRRLSAVLGAADTSEIDGKREAEWS